MSQLVGQSCVKCAERISAEYEGRFCPGCQRSIHYHCAIPSTEDGFCPGCGVRLPPDSGGGDRFVFPDGSGYITLDEIRSIATGATDTIREVEWLAFDLSPPEVQWAQRPGFMLSIGFLLVSASVSACVGEWYILGVCFLILLPYLVFETSKDIRARQQSVERLTQTLGTRLRLLLAEWRSDRSLFDRHPVETRKRILLAAVASNRGLRDVLKR